MAKTIAIAVSVALLLSLVVIFFTQTKKESPYLYCTSESEIDAQVPTKYIDLQIKVGDVPKDLYYLTGGGPSFAAGCTETSRLAMKHLYTESILEYEYIYKEYQHELTPITSDTIFTIKKAFTIKPTGINTAFSTSITYYLLEDSNGVLSTVPNFTFDCMVEPDSCNNIVDW